MANRAPGLYWVREKIAPDKWMTAKLRDDGWWDLIGSSRSFTEETFAEIAERAERGSRGLLPEEIAGPKGIVAYDLPKPASQLEPLPPPWREISGISAPEPAGHNPVELTERVESAREERKTQRAAEDAASGSGNVFRRLFGFRKAGPRRP